MDWEALRQQLAQPHTHPNESERLEWAGQVLDWALHHIGTLPEQPIGQYLQRTTLEPLLYQPAPEGGQPFADVLNEFQTKVTPNAFRTNHPRFLAFVPGAPSFPSVMGDWLCAAANFFCGVWLEASGPTQVEITVLDWFKSLLHYPAEARGILTSGGSEANLTALVVARNRLPFPDRSRAVLYVSEQRHWSIDRAANIIGLHPNQIRTVAADSQHRLTVPALASAVQTDVKADRLPWAVVANAGSTRTGTVDPLRPLAQFCKSQGLWLHVDAAYGWSAVLIPEGAEALDGISEADSITFDPHKWFGQSFEAGGLLVRQGRMLPETFAQRPDYLQDVAPEEEEINFCDHGIALTRRFRALKIWLSVKVLGLTWFRQLVERCVRLAEFAQQTLERAGDFEIVCTRQLSIVCFRFRPKGWRGSEDDLDRHNLQMLEALRKTGRAFLSSTRLNGRVVGRMCFINWRTTAADVEEIVGLLEKIAARIQ
jgi:glutamate/tyrosine decarboxylase-like PLP-dependent enzyme